MKTLLISDLFPPRTGGSSRWFWEIYRRLPPGRFVVAAGEDARQASFDRTHDLHVVRLPLTLASWGVCSVRGLAGYWRAFRRLRPLLRSEQVEQVHCGRCLPEGLLALALKRWTGVPYLCYVHGEEMNYASTSRELSWLMHRVLKGAAFVIANSRNTHGILTQEWGLPGDRVRLLHPGVDTQQFVPAARDPIRRGRLGWADRPVLLTVGRLQKRKGHDQMIRALRQVRAAIPGVLYAIVGDGEERAFLQELATREGVTDSVQFLGEVDDARLIGCYQQCDLFVLPNRQVGKDIEGFGMVLLEAQACGKAVLAGASGGTAETMRIPETGRVVACDGPDELGQAVSDWLADPGLLARKGAAAREWVVERFDWTALAEEAERLFGLKTPAAAERVPAEALPS